ncbi:MAG: hypothetical protein LBR07_04450 [Puniceicoccales bacterium]|nr:hypothetical protein [Puniceicoccales bacterium]
MPTAVCPPARAVIARCPSHQPTANSKKCSICELRERFSAAAIAANRAINVRFKHTDVICLSGECP